MAPKIFIDGEHGTTGLQIRERLAGRTDIELLSIPAAERRNNDMRTAMLRNADIAILCLPDDAAREAVALAQGAATRFIDASTAHRTDPAWAFGFAELEPGQADKIRNAPYVSNPGCYSTGAIALLRPLTLAGVLPSDYPVTINAVSGYSGGGKQMIAQMEDATREDAIASNLFVYGLTLAHKHVPEIVAHGQLTRRPIFSPSVGRFAQGMLVQVPLHLDLLHGKPDGDGLRAIFAAHYGTQDVVRVVPFGKCAALSKLDPEALNGTNTLEIFVFTGADGQTANLVARLDNLGKGASGAAVQNMDLMIG
jgi:N-acetyl-gamma-glutamyl-phosphate reductase